MIKLETVEDYQKWLSDNTDRVCALIKHSERCPVSVAGFGEFKKAITKLGLDDSAFALVDVLANRELAKHIERVTGIVHESPQVIVYRAEKPVWHASHGAVSADAVVSAFSENQN